MMIILYKLKVKRNKVYLPRWLRGKKSACEVENTDSLPGLGRSSGEGSDNPFQYSCLGNPMDRGSLWAISHSVMKRVRHDLAINPPPQHTHTHIEE